MQWPCATQAAARSGPRSVQRVPTAGGCEAALGEGHADDEVAALLQTATGPADRVLVFLGAHAGLRAQECVERSAAARDDRTLVAWGETC
jgi:hypothetical protein